MMTEQELREKEVERWWDFAQKSLGYAKDYGSSTIQALILVNGGAIIASLTAITTLLGKNEPVAKQFASGLMTPVSLFVVGVLAAVSAGGVGYLNFSALASTPPGPSELRKYTEDGTVAGWNNKQNFVVWTARTAAVLVIVSGILFVGAALLAIKSIARLTI